jgi:hypothetical protein
MYRSPPSRAICFTFGVMLTTIAGCDEQPDGDPIAASEGETLVPTLADGEEFIGGELVGEVELEGGSKVIFIGLGGPEDVKEVAVVSVIAPGGVDPSADPELAEASPRELWNAVADPATPIPEPLGRLYDEPQLGPQGWLRTAQPPTAAPSICNNTDFQNAVRSYGYDDHLLFYLNQVPAQAPSNLWIYYRECFGTSFPQGCPVFYKFWVTLVKLDKYYGRVAVCGLDQHPPITGNYTHWSHPGPEISFLYRRPGQQNFTSAYSVDVAANEVGKRWHFHSYTLSNTDWRTRITLAKHYDKFHVGVAAEKH